jgi:putative RNA 2'-phosphotransferase
MSQSLKSLSKFLSLVLRHQPEKIGLQLDKRGWADVDQLLQKVSAAGRPISREILQKLVAENDKQRFRFSEDGRRIRASQGHSIDIDSGLEARCPPDVLFHGTATRFLPSIREQGLTRQTRLHVHLSQDQQTAVQVGRRHGQPAVLRIDAARMHEHGRPFYLSDNGVWLTESVPSEYIQFPEDS